MDLTAEQRKKINTLIKGECCNYDSGNCALLDDGNYHKCPQLSQTVISCEWFLEAVLPLNAALEAEIFNTSKTTKKCIVCGKEIISNSNRVKYCMKCASKTHRKQKTEKQRKYRMHVDI